MLPTITCQQSAAKCLCFLVLSYISTPLVLQLTVHTGFHEIFLKKNILIYPSVQWYSNGHRLVQDSRHKIIVNESGCHTLLISNAQLSDTGALTCVARNRSGEAIAQVFFTSNTFYVIFTLCTPP